MSQSPGRRFFSIGIGKRVSHRPCQRRKSERVDKRSRAVIAAGFLHAAEARASAFRWVSRFCPEATYLPDSGRCAGAGRRTARFICFASSRRWQQATSAPQRRYSRCPPDSHCHFPSHVACASFCLSNSRRALRRATRCEDSSQGQLARRSQRSLLKGRRHFHSLFCFPQGRKRRNRRVRRMKIVRAFDTDPLSLRFPLAMNRREPFVGRCIWCV